MKMYGGVNVQNHLFWVSELVGGEWSASLYSQGKSTSTHWIGGWVAPEPVWMT
jgi:hypothetical protein